MLEPSPRPRHPELALSIDLQTGAATPLPDTTMVDLNIWERRDLQRWIEEHPDLVGPDLLVVATEFDQWQIRDKRVADRLDVLFLDAGGSLLVAELKRDAAPDATELQALKYAAYCSQLTVADVIEQFARHHQVDPDHAEAAIYEHAPALKDRELGPIRVRIVAPQFGPSVTHVVLFLIDHDLDIGCVEIRARRHGDDQAILTSRQLLPPPVADDYLVQRRRREQAEEQREASTRRRNSVIVITEAEALQPGDLLDLNLNAFTAEQRALVEPFVAESPEAAKAEWTGEGIRNALRWRHDGKVYSCTNLITTLLNGLGIDPGSVPGPDYWVVPTTGQNLYETAYAIENDSATGTLPAP